MMNETIIYTAGLFDGEGHISIGKSSPAKYNEIKNPSHWLQVGITSTNKELLDWLKYTFGGHISHSTNIRHQDKNGYQHRDCWSWRVMSNQAKIFLEQVFPYLRIKKQQAQLAIEFQEHRSGLVGSKRITKEVLAQREEYRKQIKQLNKNRHIFGPDAS